MTAALPLSQMSVTRECSVPEPDAGIGRCTCTDCDPCSTWVRSMSMPGIARLGGIVRWNPGATTPNDGSTRRRSSSKVSLSAAGSTGSSGRWPAPIARW